VEIFFFKNQETHDIEGIHCTPDSKFTVIHKHFSNCVPTFSLQLLLFWLFTFHTTVNHVAFQNALVSDQEIAYRLLKPPAIPTSIFPVSSQDFFYGSNFICAWF